MKKFIDYVQGQGKKFVDIKGGVAGDLGDQAVAAIIHDGIEGYILGNCEKGENFDQRSGQFAQKYQVSKEIAVEYAMTHEMAHAAGYKSEKDVEGFLKQYFETQAFKSSGQQREKYVKLASIAANREKHA